MSNTLILRIAMAVLAIVALVLLGELAVIAPHAATVVILTSSAWIAWPGIVLARRVFPVDRAGIAAWLFGPALGFGLGVFGLFLCWVAGLQSWLAIVVGPLLTWGVAALARRVGGPTLRVPVFDTPDFIAVAGVLLIVPLVTWQPYEHVRERVADGEAYRAYFTADFVWGMTVTAELAKGHVPPRNPFLRGAPLRYYWMSHMLSGAFYRNVRGWGMTAEQVLLIDGLVFGVIAVLFLYGLARVSGATPVMAALAVAVAFVANSYEGAERLWVYRHLAEPLQALRTINIDAVTRWFYEGMPVDGLQRMLLYQPHHLTGYMLSLSALWLVACAEEVTETSVSLWVGILLGLGFLFSTFTAIVVGVAAGLVFGARLAARGSLRGFWQCAVLGGAPVILAVAVATVLGYTDPAQGLLIQFGLNPVATRQWPLMLFLSFGPMLIGGVIGLTRWRWVGGPGAAPAALVASALAFYFLTDVPDEGGVWVGWRSGHLLLIAFSMISGALMTAAWRIHRLRPATAVLAIIVIGPAIPTVAIDVYNAQDVTNRARGPGFPWTLIVSPPEREALDWLRAATSPDAIVQYEPTVRGAGWWCYLTAFAERRMAAGLPGSMIPRRPYEEASQTVRQGIFGAPTAADSHMIAVNMGIDYLFVGSFERHSYRQSTTQIAERPDLFEPVFGNDAITIYQIRR